MKSSPANLKQKYKQMFAAKKKNQLESHIKATLFYEKIYGLNSFSF